MGISRNKFYLVTEFILLFYGVPLSLLWFGDILHPSTVLLPFLLLIFFLLRFRTGFHFGELLYWQISKTMLWKNLVILIATAVIIIGFVWIYSPEELFNLPKANVGLWLGLCAFYPPVSGFAQEVIFRTFIYRRYKSIFRHSHNYKLASAASFSFAHILYYHPISMIFSFALGIYLADQYLRTGSVLFTAVLHGILGIMAFSFGLGEYFWLDMKSHF